MRDTDKDWARIANENPYWGVLSDEQFRGKELSPEKRKLFFQSGTKFIEDVIGFVKRYIDAEYRPSRSLDFGCGVGRLLIPLARISEEVVGIDVAPGMLELAQQNLKTAGIANVVCVLGDDNLSQVTGSFNFVNSLIVLQHVPPERGMLLVRKLLAFLEIGGIFSLQVTFAKERRFFSHEQALAQYYRRDGTTITDLLPQSKTRPEGEVTMFDYDLNEFMLAVIQVSGVPILVVPTNHDGHVGVQMVGMKARNAP